jgi:hypothetical protein
MGTLEDILGIGIILAIAYVGWSALSGGNLLGPAAAAAPTPTSTSTSTPASYGYGSGVWSSQSWARIKKTVKPDRAKVKDRGQKDSDDSKVCMVAVGEGAYRTNGDGTFDLLGSSPRIVTLGKWTNVEETVYVYTGNADFGFNLRPKTDHYCVTSGDFGGYIVNFAFDKKNIDLRKEESHAKGYSKRMNTKPLNVPKNTWVGCRAVAYNVGNNVKLEAWVDMGSGFKKITEGIDDGSWKGKPVTGSSGGSAIRGDPESDVTGKIASSIKFKNWTVREISLGAGSSIPKPKQSAAARAYYAYSQLYYPKIPMSLSS